jgi:hypothetical protein
MHISGSSVRPISQTGLLRTPRNPNQRAFVAGGVPQKRTVLKAFNEALKEAGDKLYLHATKGWKKA